ncbi:neural cell adhesion molecule 1-like isoform X2 [Symsagittifera roscoffensis]|uniref:neural cell adhesion molecule 1-like isoform X2 n=1 Tax=Symsagittifera roscoffensis TaxID=84072 RepID=UPI00307BCAD9
MFYYMWCAVVCVIWVEGKVKITDKWNREVTEVKLSQYYNQMFPLYCKTDKGDTSVRWEAPLEANRTGLVGVQEGGSVLVVSVPGPAGSAGGNPGTFSGTGALQQEAGRVTGDDEGEGEREGEQEGSVIRRLKGQFRCSNTLSPSDHADVFLTAPYLIDVKAEPVQYVTKGYPGNLSCVASFQDPKSTKNSLQFKKSSPVAPSISPELNKFEVYAPSSGLWSGEWRLGLMVADQSSSGRFYCVAAYNKFDTTAQASFKVVVDEMPRFVRRLPSVVEVLRGESVSIACMATGLPSPSYKWKMTQSYDHIPPAGERVRVTDNGTLVLSQVRPKDGGQYECHSHNRAGSIMQTTLLQVNYKASLVPIASRVVTETEQFSVKCVVLEAQPHPHKFSWTLNSLPIYTGEYKDSVFEVQSSLGANNVFTSTLWFKKLHRSGSVGEYACEVQNAVGISRATFTVDVHYRPYPTNGKVEETVKAFEGSDICIECQVDAKPSVANQDFLWTFAGQKLINYRNVTYVDGQITTNTLYINNMPSSFLGGHSTRGGSVSGEHGDGGEDAGNFQHSTFQCTVANSVGQLTKLFRMYRLNRPGEAFFRSKFLDITPTSARVRVQLPIIEDAKEEMTEYLFQIDEAGQLDQKPELRPIVPVNYNEMTRIAEFEITGLHFSSEYIVSVAAVNRGGTGPFVQAPEPLQTADDRVPYQPTVDVVHTGSTNHTFKYTVVNNGGHPILTYTLTYFCRQSYNMQGSGEKLENVLHIAAAPATDTRPVALPVTNPADRSLWSDGIFTVSNLLPNSTCQLKLRAENKKGYGPEFIWLTKTNVLVGTETIQMVLWGVSVDLLLIALGVTLLLFITLCLLMDFCMYLTSANHTGGCIIPLLCNNCCCYCCCRNFSHGSPSYAASSCRNASFSPAKHNTINDYNNRQSSADILRNLEYDPREINL